VHIDVFSLPVFVDVLLGKQLNAGLYKLPIYITVLLSCFVPFIKDVKLKYQTVLLLVMLISLTFFLSYNSVWEYQYASVLPITALLPLLWSDNVFYKKYIPAAFIACLFISLPSFYFLVKGNSISDSIMSIVHFGRVVPVTFLFVLLLVPVISVTIKEVIKPVIKAIGIRGA